MTGWNYFGIVDPVIGSEPRPRGLLRQAEDAPMHEAEILSRRGEWIDSDLPYRIWLGKEYDELHPLTKAEAAALVRAHEAQGTLERIPGDLVEP